jgi:hypothetical protein
MPFFKEKPKCPYNHCLQAFESQDDFCDLCHTMCQGTSHVCIACSFWTICTGCYEGLKSIWDIMKYQYEYDERYIPKCTKHHTLRLKHPVEGKCRECSAPYAYTCCDYPLDRNLDHSCLYFLCKQCYRNKTFDLIKSIKQHNFNSCSYCEDGETPGRRLIIETDPDATCSSCSEPLEGRATFQCNLHPRSRICRKCRTKEKFGQNDEEETVAHYETQEMDFTCNLCTENVVNYINGCGHAYCGKCLGGMMQTQNHTCPYCRTPIKNVIQLRN